MRKRQVILDTETTGLDPKQGHRVIEIGCVEVIDRCRAPGRFHAYINPERDVPIEAFNVHKISSAFLRDKPTFAQIAQSFLDFVGDSELIIHNAPFDLGFLNHELELLNYARLSNQVIDTLSLARRKFPRSPASLNALCKRFGINVKQRDEFGHGALLDSELLYDVFICLAEGVQSEMYRNEAERGEVGLKVKATNVVREPRSFDYPEDFELNRQFCERYGLQ